MFKDTDEDIKDLQKIDEDFKTLIKIKKDCILQLCK